MRSIQQIVDDVLLERYVELDIQIKLLTKEKEDIKKLLIEVGPFFTENYVCSINDRERVGLKGLEMVAEAIGMDILEEYKLISKSFYKIVSVSKREL